MSFKISPKLFSNLFLIVHIETLHTTLPLPLQATVTYLPRIIEGEDKGLINKARNVKHSGNRYANFTNEYKGY